MNTTLAQAFPHIAAQIDAERVLLTRPIAEHTTCEWSEKEILLLCDDDATYQLLTTPSQAAYLRRTFSLPIHAMRNFPMPDAPQVNQPPTENSEPRTTKRTANALTFHERKALENWMQQPDNTHLVAHESDADAARQATKDLQLIFHEDPKDPLAAQRQTFPDLTITAGNIASMRKLLGIEKVKPQKPQPLQLPEGLSLADLQARVQAHEERLDAMHVEATGMKATIAELHDRLKTLITLKNYNADPACCIPPLTDLPIQSGQ